MKKNLNKIAILFVTLLAVSCSSDDSTSFSTENPLASYESQAGFTTVTNFLNSGDYEFGLAFSPNVTGKMKAITVKLPEANANLRVTIWDYTEQTVVSSQTINVAEADVLTTKAITAINLEKDKKYLITMNSNDWYKKAKADDANATYPITAGNIKFWEYRWAGGTTQTFPTNVSLNYNGGDLSFDFQQTE